MYSDELKAVAAQINLELFMENAGYDKVVEIIEKSDLRPMQKDRFQKLYEEVGFKEAYETFSMRFKVALLLSINANYEGISPEIFLKYFPQPK